MDDYQLCAEGLPIGELLELGEHTVTRQEIVTLCGTGGSTALPRRRGVRARRASTASSAVARTARRSFSALPHRARVAGRSTRSAMLGLTRPLATDPGPHGIAVRAVVPGLTGTRLV